MKNFKFNINENSYNVKIVGQENNIIELEVNGTSYSVKMKEEVKVQKTPTLVRKPVSATAQPAKITPATQNQKVTAPIPGTVLAISVKVGDTVKVNDQLLVLEAMKMENHIVSEVSGVIKAINVTVGQQILQGTVMIEIE